MSLPSATPLHATTPVQPEINSYSTGIVDLMIKPSLTINSDLTEKHQEEIQITLGQYL